MRLSRLLLVLLLGGSASTALAGPERAAWLKNQRAQARQALQRLGGSNLTVQWPAFRSRPAVIRGLAVKVTGAGDRERAHTFLTRHPALFAGAGSRLVHEKTLGAGDVRAVRFRQVFKGVPVEGATIAVALDRAGRVTSVTSDMEPITLRQVKPRITGHAAVKIAIRATGTRAAAARGLRAHLVILPGGTDRLVYKVMLPFGINPRGRWHLVDAMTGKHAGYLRGIIMDGHRWQEGVRP